MYTYEYFNNKGVGKKKFVKSSQFNNMNWSELESHQKKKKTWEALDSWYSMTV